MTTANAASEVGAGLDKLAQSEVALQKGLGQSTLLAIGENPFAPARLKTSREHRDRSHPSRDWAVKTPNGRGSSFCFASAL